MQQIQLPVTQVGLEQSIASAMQKAGRSAQINLGTSARQINAISQPLGRITGQADDFAKSMSAANARVLAFGASVGIMGAVSRSMKGVVQSAREVEKSLTEINTILNITTSQLEQFGQQIFDVAKNTGQTFDIVAKAALELSRQGLGAEETLKRLNDALILSRLSGLDAAKSVEGLTAAFNSFADVGITTEEILNKLVSVSQKFAVSERDLIEGLKRSASVANQAGVSFNELIAIITAVQERTARGGAVIGNSFKTIFARIQDKAVLSDLQDLGVQVTDLQGKLLPATTILQNLSKEMDNLTQIEQADLAKKLGGVFQLSNLLAALKDLNSENSRYAGALEAASQAADQAYKKNATMNETLDALINRVTVSAKQLGATLGEIGVTDSIKNLLGFFNGLLEGIQKILGEESAMSGFFKGLVKGIGNLITGPGLALFGAIILKLSKDLVQFGFSSLKSFFGIGKAAKQIKDVESSIQQILSRNVDLQQKLFSLEGNRAAQLKVITDALVQQEALLRRSATTAASMAPALYGVGGRASSTGLRLNPPKTAAEGFMPAVSQEKANIQKGVGGARSGDKPVVIPNFSFGGGKRGTMVAHTGEYIVPNFAGGGSAIFNRDMVRSMGLPSGAKKINAAGGFVPNFAQTLEEKIRKARSSSSSMASLFRENPEAVRVNFPEEYARRSNTPKGINPSQLRVGKNATISNQIDVDLNGKIGVVGVSNERGGLFTNASTSDFSDEDIEALKRSGLMSKTASKKEAPKISFKNIALSSLQGPQGGKDQADKLQNQFRKSVNRLFTRPAQQLAGELFGKVFQGNDLSDYESSLVQEKDIFSDSVLGGIFESSVNLATKTIEQLPAFGSSDQNKPFDFEENKAASANFKKLFFSQAPNLRRADAKKTINSSTVRTVINKAVRDPEGMRIIKSSALNQGSVAAGGYIPNFANYVYDSDQLTPDKRKEFLDKIMKSPLKKNALLAPAGAGKTTIANKIGPFIKSAADISKASEFTILSAAARAKDGGLSKPFQNIVSSVAKSGGKLSYLYVPSLEIKNRRSGRSALAGDLRSGSQLKGTRYAPLNQYDFVSKIKKELGANFEILRGAEGYIPNFALSPDYVSSTLKRIKEGTSGFSKQEQETFLRKFGPRNAQSYKFTKNQFLQQFGGKLDDFGRDYIQNTPIEKLNKELQNNYLSGALNFDLSSIRSKGGMFTAADGFIPNFVGKNRMMGSGVQGSFYKLNDQVGVKKFFKDSPSQALQVEWLTGEYLNKYAKVPAVSGPAILSSLSDSIRKRSIRKQVISDPLAKVALGSEVSGSFGKRVLYEALRARGLSIGDLHGSNYTVNKPSKDYIDSINNYPTNAIESFGMLRQMAAKGGLVNVIDTGAARVSSPAREVIGRILQNQSQKKTAASGYVPNFNSPLKDAIDREMSAGIPSSQIYVDQNPRLKNAMNPMGLMVANRRDEPSGGYQGINRAIKEGRNPQTYGAAKGFVPNYAPIPLPSTSISGAVEKQLGDLGKKSVEEAKKAIDAFAAKTVEAGANMDQLAAELAQTLKNLKVQAPEFVAKTSREYAEEMNKSRDQIKAQNAQQQAQADAAKIAAEAANKAKQAEAASNFINAEQNKKVRGVVNRVLDSYNKTAQTDADLMAAKKQLAEALKKQGVDATAIQNITESTGTLSAKRVEDKKQGGERDLLGVIFAVQAGLSVMSGFLGESNKGLGLFMKEVTSAASSITSLIFAQQGLDKISKGMIDSGGAFQVGAGKFLKGLGVAGVAVGAAFSIFKAGKSLYYEYSGANERAAKAATNLAQAAQDAAFRLEDFDPQGQAKIKERADYLFNKLKQSGRLQGISQPEQDQIKNTILSIVPTTSDKAIRNLIDASSPSKPEAPTVQGRTITTNASRLNLQEFNQGALPLMNQGSEIKEIFREISQGVPSEVIRGMSFGNVDVLSILDTIIPKIKNFADSPPEGVSRSQFVQEQAAALRSMPGNEKMSIVGSQKLIGDNLRYQEEERRKREKADSESQNQFRINTTQIKIESSMQTKLNAIRNKALEDQIDLQKELFKAQNNLTLNESARAKAIAQVNKEIEKQATKSKTLETQQENLLKAAQTALKEGVTLPADIGKYEAFEEIFSFFKDQEAFLTDAFKRPEDIIDQINAKIKLMGDGGKKLQAIFGSMATALAEALRGALGENVKLTDEQERTLQLLEERIELEEQGIDNAAQRKNIEQQINNLFEQRYSGNLLQLESGKISLEKQSLSINQKIAEVRDDSLKSAVMKAKEMVALEERLRGLQGQGVDLDYQESVINFRSGLESDIRSIVSASGVGGSDAILSNRTLEELITAARAALSEPEEQFDAYLASLESKIRDFKQRIEIAGKKRELGILGTEKTDKTANDILLDQVSGGFSLGFGNRKADFGNQIDLFEFQLGQQIPDLFADNMAKAMSDLIDRAGSFGDVLKNAAYNFAREINSAFLKTISQRALTGLTGGSIFAQKLATGGAVQGGSGIKDDVPAMLMGGEYVIKKQSVNKYGSNFLEAVNNGTLMGYAKGGMVQRGPQGSFYTPGTYGKGAIEGKRDLLDFATQSGTSGEFDKIINEAGFASIALSPESSRLSVSGMRSSPMFEATQSAKQDAFGLYLQQYNQELEDKKRRKEEKRALRNQLLMMVGTAVLSSVLPSAFAGAKANIKSLGAGATIREKIGAGLKGIYSGGMIDGQNVGGLKNLFSGVGQFLTGNREGGVNLMRLSRIGSLDELTKLTNSNESFRNFLGRSIEASLSGDTNISNALKQPSVAGAIKTVSPNFRANQTNAFSGGSTVTGIQRFDNFKDESLFGNPLIRERGDGYNTNALPLDKNYPSLLPPLNPTGPKGRKIGNQLPKRATGGAIPSTSNIDTVPAMLSGGEFIMNRSAVQNIGQSNLQSMNAGAGSMLTEEKSKELNEKLIAKLDELIEVSGSSGDITINVSSSGESTDQQGGMDGAAARQQLARQVKDAVMKVIEDEKRLGGQLRRR
jgi:TP901 family phage tail tape measure protein